MEVEHRPENLPFSDNAPEVFGRYQGEQTDGDEKNKNKNKHGKTREKSSGSHSHYVRFFRLPPHSLEPNPTERRAMNILHRVQPSDCMKCIYDAKKLTHTPTIYPTN